MPTQLREQRSNPWVHGHVSDSWDYNPGGPDTTQHHDFQADEASVEILGHRSFAERIQRRMGDDPLERGVPASEALERMRNRDRQG